MVKVTSTHRSCCIVTARHRKSSYIPLTARPLVRLNTAQYKDKKGKTRASPVILPPRPQK